MKYKPYTKEELESVCKDSRSLAEVLRKFGRSIGGGTYTTLNNKIKEFNIDISHFTGKGWCKGETSQTNESVNTISKHKKKYSFEEIFCKNSPVSQHTLIKYVERNNLIPYKCQNCGCDGTWQGQTIALELHHIDGNNTNNELSNLEYLCPNCHALTDSYRKRKTNTTKPNDISDEEFLEAINTTPNIYQALIKLGLNPHGSNYKRARRLKSGQVQNINITKGKNNHKKREYYCIDCGNPVSKGSIRCLACENKYRTTSLDKMPITRQELKDKIRTIPILQIAKEYNVSNATICKWCDKFGLPRTKKKIKSYSDEEWDLI